MRKLLLLALLFVLLAACSPTLPPSFSDDMKAYLAQKGLNPTDLKCALLGNGVVSGPDGMCLLSLSESDVTTLIDTLGLVQKTDTIVSWEPSGPDCWTRLDFHDVTSSKWYLTPDNMTNMTFVHGTQLKYFRLFFVEYYDKACISVSYVQ